MPSPSICSHQLECGVRGKLELCLNAPVRGWKVGQWHHTRSGVFVPPANSKPSNHLLTQVWGFGTTSLRIVQKDLCKKINFWSHPYSLVLAAPEFFPVAICKKKKSLTNLSHLISSWQQCHCNRGDLKI